MGGLLAAPPALECQRPPQRAAACFPKQAPSPLDTPIALHSACTAAAQGMEGTKVETGRQGVPYSGRPIWQLRHCTNSSIWRLKHSVRVQGELQIARGPTPRCCKAWVGVMFSAAPPSQDYRWHGIPHSRPRLPAASAPPRKLCLRSLRVPPNPSAKGDHSDQACLPPSLLVPKPWLEATCQAPPTPTCNLCFQAANGTYLSTPIVLQGCSVGATEDSPQSGQRSASADYTPATGALCPPLSGSDTPVPPPLEFPAGLAALSRKYTAVCQPPMATTPCAGEPGPESPAHPGRCDPIVSVKRTKAVRRGRGLPSGG